MSVSLVRSTQHFLFCSSLLWCFSCGDAVDETVADRVVEPVGEGVYRVHGTKIEVGGDRAREIKGIVVLRKAGTEFHTSFDLATSVPSETEGAELSIEVIGQGIGALEPDGSLRGDATTQLLRASVPGVDARFPFLPRSVGPQVASVTEVWGLPDGRISIRIQSLTGPAEAESAIRTTLIGQRVGAMGSGALPDVASGPPPELIE
jgi:hypothetical protein